MRSASMMHVRPSGAGVSFVALIFVIGSQDANRNMVAARVMVLCMHFCDIGGDLASGRLGPSYAASSSSASVYALLSIPVATAGEVFLQIPCTITSRDGVAGTARKHREATVFGASAVFSIRSLG